MQACRPAFVLMLLLSTANMVIYFGIAKKYGKKKRLVIQIRMTKRFGKNIEAF